MTASAWQRLNGSMGGRLRAPNNDASSSQVERSRRRSAVLRQMPTPAEEAVVLRPSEGWQLIGVEVAGGDSVLRRMPTRRDDRRAGWAGEAGDASLEREGKWI